MRGPGPGANRACCARRDDWELRVSRRGPTVTEVSLRRVAAASLAPWLAAALWLPLALAAAAPLRPLLEPLVLAALGLPQSPTHPPAPPATLFLIAPLVFSLLLPLAWWRLRRGGVVEESVLAVRGLGLTLTTSAAAGPPRRRFIDAGSLKSIVVSEVMQSCDISFVLACVVAGRGELLLPFEVSRPRLPVIARIFRALQRTMFDENGVDDKDEEGNGEAQ